MERLKRLSEADCRKKQTGLCTGCPVLNIANARLHRSWTDLNKVSAEHLIKKYGVHEERVIRKVRGTLCPKGETVLLPRYEIEGHFP